MAIKGKLVERNVARVSLVALKRALGVKEKRLTYLTRRSTWGGLAQGAP